MSYESKIQHSDTQFSFMIYVNLFYESRLCNISSLCANCHQSHELYFMALYPLANF